MTNSPRFLDPTLQKNYVRDIYVFDAYDGDTIYFHADLGYGHWAMFQTGRLLDVQAPELRPLKSRDQAKRSLDYLQYLYTHHAINRGKYDEIKTFGCHLKAHSARTDNRWFSDLPADSKGKFGRWLVTLVGADDDGLPINLNERMISEGFAASYGPAEVRALGFEEPEIKMMSL